MRLAEGAGDAGPLSRALYHHPLRYLLAPSYDIDRPIRQAQVSHPMRYLLRIERQTTGLGLKGRLIRQEWPEAIPGSKLLP